MAVPVVKLQDPQLDIVERNYYAKVGGSDVTYQRIKAISTTNSQIIFNTTTPSVNVGLSRRMKVGIPIKVTVNTLYTAPVDGGAAGTITQNFPLADLVAGNVGLRAYPIAAVTENLSLKLNNSTINTNLCDIIHPMMEFGTSPDERNKWRSTEPSYPDQFDNSSFRRINDWGQPAASARSMFALYENNPVETSRSLQNFAVNIALGTYRTGAFPGTAGANQVTSFDLYLVSDVFISPLNWTEKDSQALFGIQTIDLSMVYTGSLQRIFSGYATNGETPPVPTIRVDTWTVNVDQEKKATLYLSYISPQINQPIPKLLHYPYYDVNRYISNQQEKLNPSTMAYANSVQSAAANTNPATAGTLGINPLLDLTDMSSLAGGSIIVDNITLHAIPKRLYIFAVRPKNVRITGTLNFVYSDTYAAIKGVNINWNNRAGVLSSADSYQLYSISVRNGLDMSFYQWSRVKGSVLCLEPSVDIPLTAVQAPGTRGNYQISYSININNISSYGANAKEEVYQAYTVAVQEGFMTINDSVIALDVGVLTEQSVLDAPFAPAGTYNAITHMYGGGFWGDMWRGIKKGVKWVRDIGTKGSKVVGDVAGALSNVPIIGQYAAPVAGVANAVHGVGQALGGRRRKSKRAGSRGGSRSGGYLSGGKRMSQRSLSRRVR